MEKKKILIVEDHPLFRAMLVQLINQELGMTVCGEADNIRDAMAIVETARPDAAIVDLTLHGSSGLELIKDVKARGWQLPVLVLSMHEDKLYAERVLRAGALGYVSKQESPAKVIEAMRKVMSGQICISDRVSGTILARLAKVSKAPLSGVEALADRELEVFEMIGRGFTTNEIATRLNLGQATVETYRRRIREKLGLKKAAELYQRAALWVAESSG